MKSTIALPPLLLVLASCGSSGDSDSARFTQWQQEGSNKAEVAVLRNYLARQGVGAVIPIRQLLRSDTKWRRCGAEPFDVPPQTHWAHIVPTLALIRDEVIPLIGPVEAQSVFRAAEINRCIKGASRSYHLRFHAIDMRPAKSVSRADLIEKLCTLHASKGKVRNMGLGIYRGTRFHIDTAGYRRWGHDHRAGSSPCTSFVAPQRESR
jgi:Peptidase M15